MSRRQAVLALGVVCLVWGVSFTLIKETLAYASPLVLLGALHPRAAVTSFLLLGERPGAGRRHLAAVHP